MTIERMLRDIRMERGLSQEGLAELVNVSRQTVSKWETGAAYPSGDNLAELSRVLGLPVDALVNGGWVPPEERPPEVQVVEVPVEVKVPVEVPVPRNYRLVALLAAVVLAAGILMGALFFRERHEDSVSQSQLEGEVIDPSTMGAYMPMLPLE